MLSLLRPLWVLSALTLLLAAPISSSLAKPTPTRGQQAVLEKSGLRLHLVAPDLAKLQREDMQRDGDKAAPLRYGRVLPVGRLDAMRGAGVWTRLADGDWAWRLEVQGKGAKSLEFGFSRFRLPHGAQLSIRGANGGDALAPLDERDNPISGGLHTGLLQSDHAVLELRVPAAARDFVQLQLARVSWGYRDPFAALRAKSGSCNIDATCPEGDDWRDEIAAVAGYSFSASTDRLMCSGTLMNTGDNAKDSSKPRFATAYHCVADASEAASMVFYWGYESPSCRTVGSAANGTPLPVRPNTRAVQTGGASLISTNQETDFTVVELNSAVPAEAQAYYSGWDRSGAIPPGTVGIHHPDGHEKRLVFEDDPATTMYNCITAEGANNTHWRVGPYELGTTEGGSSGSGLWSTANGLLIGVLSGGNALCSNPSGYDCYGRLSQAWSIVGDTGTSIRQALDRSGANPQTMPGKSSCDAPQVSLSSAAGTVQAGQSVELRVSASGGAGGYTYLWDTDGDGVVEREGGSAVKVSYPQQRSLNVWVHVRDSAGCIGSATRALDVAAPVLEVAEIGATQQVCGNGDGVLDPGERHALAITFANTGAAASPAGARALFAPGSSLEGNGNGNLAGYEGAAQCGYQFIDLARGAHAVAPLTTHVANGNTFGPLDDARSSTITLGGPGFTLYGRNWDQAVMSTNGYVSFDPDETGGDFWVDCSGALDEGARGPQLRPYHDDMVVGDGADAGLRYRWFASCPRVAASGVAQGCHVFQWTGMGYWMGQDEDLWGDFEFQAVAYADTGEVAYQYSEAAPDEGDLANIGLVGVGGADPLNLWCESHAQPAKGDSAICIHSPQALADAKPLLRLEVPTLELPAIPAGGSATVELPFAVAADAACGSPLRVDYLAAASATSNSSSASRHEVGRVATTCKTVASCPIGGEPIDTRDGNYSNTERLGNGFNYHVFGGVWYTAAADHTPSWYLTTGEFRDNLLAGPLLYTTFAAGFGDFEIGTPPPGYWDLPVEQGAVGRMHLARINETRLMLAWNFQDGRSGAELLDLTTADLPRANPDRTQHWYPPIEAGWGLDVESLRLGQQRFDVVLPYFYDDAGDPRWVLGDGPFGADGVVGVNSYRPHCPGCPHYSDWEAPNRVSPAGTLKLIWDETLDRGVISTDFTLPAPMQGRWRRIDKAILPIQEIRR